MLSVHVYGGTRLVDTLWVGRTAAASFDWRVPTPTGRLARYG